MMNRVVGKILKKDDKKKKIKKCCDQVVKAVDM